MFNLVKKLKGAFKDLSNSSLKAENKDIMEAMVASAALVAYADGELSSDEVTAVRNIVGASEQLKVFGDEPMKLFDAYCDKMEASARMGKLDLLKEVSDVAGQGDNAARVLIMGIDVAYADDNCDEDETAMLNAIAGKLNLRLSDFV